MANGKTDNNGQVVRPPKKADVILRHSRQISAKTDEIVSQAKLSNARLDEVLEQLGRSRQDVAHTTRQNGEIYNSLRDEYLSIKQEMKYLAMQSENIFATITEKLSALAEELENIKSGVPVIASETAVTEDRVEPAREIVREVPSSVVVSAEIDYDMLADKVADRLPENGAVAEIDYEKLAEKVAEKMPAQEAVVSGVELDYDTIAEKVAARMPADRTVIAAAPVDGAVDYELLADKLAARFPVQEALSPEYIASKVVEFMPVTAPASVQAVAVDAQNLEIDYELLSEKVVEKMPAHETAVAVESAEFDYELLSEKVAEKMPVHETVVSADGTEVDYEVLADKLASRVAVQESLSPDYIASKVAEQLVIPQTFELDYETLADKVAERMPAVQAEAVAAPFEGTVEIDYDLLAEKVAERMPAPSATVVSSDTPVSVELDEEDLADRIALKVGSLKAEDFDILVDDEGCESISKTLADKLDYDIIAASVAEKLRAAIDYMTDNAVEPDYEEMASRISEKITVAGVNEDAIADKAAAVLSNYLPEIDTDEIADKVAEQVINAMPAVDNDYICTSISEKVIESQADNDYDIVIDDEGIDRITESVYEKVVATSGERFNSIDEELTEIKDLLANGAVIREVAVAGEAVAYEEPYVAEESLVTVSEIVESYEEETEEEAVEETAETEVVTEEAEEPADEEPAEVEEIVEEEAEEEIVEEEVEETPAEEVTEEVIEETVDEPIEETVEEVNDESVEEEVVEESAEEIEEQTESEDEEGEESDEDVEEFTLDDFASEDSGEQPAEGGVDFLNMMKYNRSFIARIIQGTDEQKTYYGEVRNALLSYKRVNSNIAWGAERFHKGRETIARFKIRGKTLVVYLALDPAEHEYSVYHHKDVSSNKSLHGTPMMIKVKSPRGVKKALRLIDEMLEARGGIKRNIPKRDYAAMYPYETIEELIEDGLVKEVKKN